MGNVNRRPEFDKWLIQLDPSLAALLQPAKATATATAKASTTLDTPYGKIYGFDADGMRRCLESYKQTMSAWHNLGRGYKDMMSFKKKIPPRQAIMSEIDRIGDSVRQSVGAAKTAQIAANVARNQLNDLNRQLEAAKQDFNDAAEELIHQHQESVARIAKELADDMQETIDDVLELEEGLASYEHNPWEAGAKLEAIIVRHLNALPEQARELQEEATRAGIKAASDKFAHAREALRELKSFKLTGEAVKNLDDAQDNAVEGASFSVEQFDKLNKGQFHFSALNEMKQWADNFISVFLDELKSKGSIYELNFDYSASSCRWASQHPRHEDNKKVMDQMGGVVKNALKEEDRYRKETEAIIAECQKTYLDAAQHLFELKRQP